MATPFAKMVFFPLTIARYIFQELVTGGDLYSYLDFRGGKLLDAEAGLVIRQILKAISYLHNLDIVHRDLKVGQLLYVAIVLTSPSLITF